MPLGWYLAQGLYPIGPSSSDDEEGPCELPDGRVVCGPHGLVVCGRCCTDYSYMDDVLSRPGSGGEDEDEEEDEDSLPGGVVAGGIFDLELERRRGTGQVIPRKFDVPDLVRPTELFVAQPVRRDLPSVTRYVHPSDPGVFLVATDGACLNNGQSSPSAGWAFVYGEHAGEPAVASGRLESKGPFGDEAVQSSNRAELRAVIAALRFRYWPGEGFQTIVIATDSEYVVEGATGWVRSWVRTGWKTSVNADVKNRDLWEMLLGEFERWEEAGLSVRFWRIPREWNTTADAAAKQAATVAMPDSWEDALGFAV